MPAFRYIGEAPNGPFHMYGFIWDHGTVNDVSEIVHVAKLAGNRFFEPVGVVEISQAAVEKRKGGRPRKEVIADEHTQSD